MTALDHRAELWSRAACTTVDPDLFFPISKSAAGQVARAKAVCACCEIRQECLDYALDARSVEGIWGGTSEAERQLIRRRLLRAQHAHEHAADTRLVGQGPGTVTQHVEAARAC
jgi:WhiB family transcriptional regulator, redox-sensing transcriptional regulator